MARVTLLFLFFFVLVVGLLFSTPITWLSVVTTWALTGAAFLLPITEVGFETPTISHSVVGIRVGQAGAAKELGVGTIDVALDPNFQSVDGAVVPMIAVAPPPIVVPPVTTPITIIATVVAVIVTPIITAFVAAPIITTVVVTVAVVVGA
jgi:hypothetical protein